VRETLDICERAYIVNSGNMLAAGTPEEVLADETVRKVYLGEDFIL
ncbi:lipopolysaccharide ABC transporter ATP-binding protein, partial [Francisella tularensis subsp. holarctica]|nr:lipopolysaccharide ABC transporter ATP-binding protein [Francisella tularensis subsp. holarctica]